MWISRMGDCLPTDQVLAFEKGLVGEIDQALKELEEILDQDVPTFNRPVLHEGIKPVVINARGCIKSPKT